MRTLFLNLTKGVVEILFGNGILVNLHCVIMPFGGRPRCRRVTQEKTKGFIKFEKKKKTMAAWQVFMPIIQIPHA